MKINFLTISFLSILLFPGCDPPEQKPNALPKKKVDNTPISYPTALEYDFFIRRGKDSVIQSITTLANYFTNPDTALIETAYNVALGVTEEWNNKAARLDGFQGNTEYGLAFRNLTGFYFDLVRNEYKEITKLFKKGGNKTPEDEAALDKLINGLYISEPGPKNKLKFARAEFLKQFRIDPGYEKAP